MAAEEAAVAEKALPWSRTCFVCGEGNPIGLGVRFVVEDGLVRVRTRLDPRFEGYPGRVHGGVITALLDETAGWACTVVVGRLCLTARISVRFLHPVPGDEPIEVIGEHLGSRGGFEQGRARLVDAEGRALASAEGQFSPVSPSLHAAIVPELRMPGRPATPEDISGTGS